MTSALQGPPVVELRASNSQETLRDARIASSAVADTMHGGIKGRSIPVQVDHLAKLMYCLPISESKSLPATAIKGATRSTSSDTIPTIADSDQISDNSKASLSVSSPLEDHDHANPKLPKRDADTSEETKAESLPHPPRCECGCIPKTPSLFEMAELRRQYRERLKNGDKSETT